MSEDGEKLYAGKFKTVEELEAGYKNSLPVFQENQTLKTKLEEVTKIPDEYKTPEGVTLHDSDLAEVKRLAKTSNLTQQQYEKLLLETNHKSKNQFEAFENAKKEIGADNLNMLQDYVKKYYPEKIGDAVLKKLILEKDARDIALQHRASLLNSQVPGMSGTRPNSGYQVTQKDVLAAREEMNNSAGKAKVAARTKYIALSREMAHSKQG